MKNINWRNVSQVLLIIIAFFFIAIITWSLTSCSSYLDGLESSHYRKFNLTKAVQVDSITNRIYVSDFLPMPNHYSAALNTFDVQEGDTILFRDYQDRIIDFRYEK